MITKLHFCKSFGKRNKKPDRGVTKWELNKCYNNMFETDLKTTLQFF